MTDASKAILTNTEIIAINQDALGLQGVQLRDAEQSVWTKPLNENGARAVVLFNEGAAAADITVTLHRHRPGRRQRQGARPAGTRRPRHVQRQLHCQRAVARDRNIEDRRLRAAAPQGARCSCRS